LCRLREGQGGYVGRWLGVFQCFRVGRVEKARNGVPQSGGVGRWINGGNRRGECACGAGDGKRVVTASGSINVVVQSRLPGCQHCHYSHEEKATFLCTTDGDTNYGELWAGAQALWVSIKMTRAYHAWERQIYRQDAQTRPGLAGTPWLIFVG
jgi:hypothetical protein